MSSVPRRPLGATGVSVSLVGLGGIMHAAIDRGIDFFDNCWDYNDGKSEERMGRALEGKRDEVFLMTKLDDARRAGKIRFVGFTGHKDPDIHLAMLEEAERHDVRFDTVQMPLNPFDAHFKSFEKLVVPVLESQKIGILGMKSLGAGKLLESRAVSALECLHYAMNLPTSVVITGMQSMRDVEQAYAAASRSVRGRRRKSPPSTSQHPKWLESAEL